MISVVMSVYNERLEWLEAAVESILSQTHRDFEYIVIIDNPQLDCQCDEYLERIAASDERVRIHRNERNMGLARSLNVGIRLARGEYIARMDADDISMPNRLEEELRVIDEHGVDMVTSGRIDIDEDGKVTGQSRRIMSNPYDVLPRTNIVVHPSVMMRTEVYRELGGYRAFYNSEDYDMWLRILSSGHSIEVIDEPLVYYRIRSNSMSQKNMLETYYITKYQQLLYRQRVRTGRDDFSEESFLAYMKTKDFSERRNRRYVAFRREMDEAIAGYKRRSLEFVPRVAKAFLLFPSAALDNVITVVGALRGGGGNE